MSDAFTCPICGMTSYNQHDIEHRYCGNCKRFIGDMIEFTGCPQCGEIRFLAGPRGGSSQNVTCCGCSARLNLLIPPIPGPLMLLEVLDRGTGDMPDTHGSAYIIELVKNE